MRAKNSKKPNLKKGGAAPSATGSASGSVNVSAKGSGNSLKTGKPPSDLARLEQVLELMGRHDIAELEWEKSGERFHLKKPGAFPSGSPVYPAPQMMMQAPQLSAVGGSTHSSNPSAPVASPADSAIPAAGTLAANQKQITSPLVGTFYRSSSPASEPYVKEGQTVKRGDAICIVEAMKLMNEIEAELSGKIVSILVENGQPVEFGEPLFLIEV